MTTTKHSIAVLFYKSLFISLLLAMNHTVFADVVCIVNPANTAELDENTIRLIFLGKKNTFPNDKKAVPIELAKGEARNQFLKQYIKKSEIDLKHYWSVKTFTGKGNTPKQYESAADIKKQVAQNPELISFIDSAEVDATVKVVDVKKSKSRINWDSN